MKSRFCAGRRTASLIASAAAATLGLAQQGQAGLFIDLRVTGVSGSGSVVNPKSVSGAAPGDIVTLDVFAQVAGTNGVIDEMMQAAGGSFASIGVLKGDLAGGIVAPFNNSSATNGSMQDFDSDGDIDLGSTGSTSTGKFFARSGPAIAVNDVGDPNTGEVRIGHITFTVTSGAGSTDIGFLVRTNSTGGPLIAAALWFEDGSSLGSNPASALYAAAAPVHVEAVPEPSSIGLLALGSVGLLARRRSDRTMKSAVHG